MIPALAMPSPNPDAGGLFSAGHGFQSPGCSRHPSGKRRAKNARLSTSALESSGSELGDSHNDALSGLACIDLRGPVAGAKTEGVTRSET